ncbi:hypothetical protein BDR05DRAFT_710141 [Suillus weaverae]|nr:hypothetical protein BDR05DRAFT_710141 [Suillus weaverae]
MLGPRLIIRCTERIVLLFECWVLSVSTQRSISASLKSVCSSYAVCGRSYRGQETNKGVETCENRLLLIVIGSTSSIQVERGTRSREDPIDRSN